MPAQFDWQSEDEKEWGDFRPEQEPRPRRWRPRRRLIVIGLALLVAATVAALAVSQASRLLESNTEEVEQDLLSGHELFLEAAAKGDGELVGGLIFDRLQEWTEAQVLLAEQGMLLDRQAMDLYLVDGAEAVSTEIDLNPNLLEGQVTMTLGYRVGSDASRPDIVDLRHVFSYRMQDGQWLLNPPTGAFWGPWQAISGRYLTLHYPQRDAQIGQRLAADLEAALGQACRTAEEMDCRPESRLEVALIADPAVLLELSDPAWQFSGGLNINLPTPTLLGLPADETAYRALYRVYAQRVVARLLTAHAGLSPETQPLLANALVDLFLERQGLRGQPLLAFGARNSGDLMLNQAELMWNSGRLLEAGANSAEAQLAYYLVEFLSEEWSTVSPYGMARLLTQADGFRDWLALLNPGEPQGSFVEAWDRYVVEHGPGVGPDAWPEEVVLLMCDQGVVGSANVYRYDPIEQILSIVMSGREFIRMEPLGNGQGVLLTELSISQEGQQVYLYQDGRLTPVDPADEGLRAVNPESGQRMTAGRPARQNSITAMSNDGRWLAELGDGYLILSATTDGLRRSVAHGGSDCQAVAWVQSARESAGQ